MFRCRGLCPRVAGGVCRPTVMAASWLTGAMHAPCRYSSSSTPGRKLQIAVVGSGPSGCFVASYLIKKHPSVHVDIFERLPVSFGLCRYGVAPDHPDVRNVETQFLQLFKSGRVTWIGNVEVGKSIPVDAMLQQYAAVVFATGADGSRKLNVPGEDLGGVISARDFVSYYNTLPFPYGSPRFCPFDLSRTSRVAVVGNGNVAMDVLRVMGGSYKYFCTTDMNCVALKELMANRIRQIDVLGRRGVESSAFAIAEFRELATTQKESLVVQTDAFDLAAALAAPNQRTTARAHKRLMELVHTYSVSEAAMKADPTLALTDKTGKPMSTAAEPPADVRGQSGAGAGRGPCTVRFRYFLQPIAVLPSAVRKNYVGGLLCERTEAADTGSGAGEKQYCVVPCDLVVKSIGYRSDPVPGLPFDEQAGVVPNTKGRVANMPRVYCSGWVKTGARGVILHSIADAQETVASILEDIEKKVIPVEGHDADSEAHPPAAAPAGTTTMHGKYGLVDYFVEKKLEPVSVAGLERILHVEKERGVDLGKSAEKMDAVRDMLDVALGGDVAKKANERFRGITPARSDAMMYLKELLDDDTDLAPLAHELAKDMPRKLAEQHPAGRISPSQL